MSNPYQLAIGPATSATPTQPLTVFDSWTLTRNLDDGCSLSWSMAANSLPGVLVRELETDVWLYRNSVLEDRFRVVSANQSWDSDGGTVLEVTAVCYRRLLAARHVLSPLSYVATSQGDIVWGLIQHTQAQTNGNLGITLGSAGPVVLRDRAYLPGQNIFEAISALTQIDGGLTWDIDASLQLQVSTPDAYPLRPQPIQLGTNALALRKPSGADLFGNVALVTGDTQTTTLEVATTITLATDVRGRWERYAAFTAEATQSSLTEQASGLLETSQSPAVVWEAQLVPQRFFTDSNYALGDFVFLVQPATVVPSQPDTTVPYLVAPGGKVLVQVLTLSVTVTADGEVTVAITAVQTPQPWDSVPTSLTWDDLDPALTWDDMLGTYLL